MFIADFMQNFSDGLLNIPEVKDQKNLIEQLKDVCAKYLFNPRLQVDTIQGRDDIFEAFIDENKALFKKKFDQAALEMDARNSGGIETELIEMKKRNLKQYEEQTMLSVSALFFKNMYPYGASPTPRTTIIMNRARFFE